MKLSDIYHPWPPNIHRYEQKILGVPMMTFMGCGMAAVIVASIGMTRASGLGGIIVGALLGAVVFGLGLLCFAKLSAFHYLPLPLYLLRRWQERRSRTRLQIPMILSSKSVGNERVVFEDWSGNEQGVLE